MSDGEARDVTLSGLLQVPWRSPGAVWTPSLWRRAPSLGHRAPVRPSRNFAGEDGPKGSPLILEPRKRRALGQLRVKVGKGWESSLPEMRLPEEITQHLQLGERMSVNAFLALAHASPVGDRSAYVCDPAYLGEVQTRLMEHSDSLAWLLLRAQNRRGEKLWLLLLDEEQRRSLVTRHGEVNWPLWPYGMDVLLPCWAEENGTEETIAGPWLVPGEDVVAVGERAGISPGVLPLAGWKPRPLSGVVRLDIDTLAKELAGKPQPFHAWVESLKASSSEGSLFLCESSAAGFKYAPGVSLPAGRPKSKEWKSGDWIQVVRVAYSEGFEEFTAPGVVRKVSGPSVPAKPDAPRVMSVSAEDGCAVVRLMPGSAGSAPIERYEYSYDGAYERLALDGGGAPDDQMITGTIKGLTNGRVYEVRLRAVNAVGSGVESLPARVVPSVERARPDAPRVVSVWAEDGCAVVRLMPGSGGSAPIEHHEYSYDGGSEWLVLERDGAPDDRTITGTIRGLTNGQAYEVRLRAVNAVGSGVESSPERVVPSAVPDARLKLKVDRALRLATGTEIGELIELRKADRVQTVSAHHSGILSTLTGSNVDRPIKRSWRSLAAWACVLGLFVSVSLLLTRAEDPEYLVFLLLWAGTLASGILLAVLTLRLLLGPRLWSAFIEVLLPTKKVMAAVQPASPTFAEHNCIALDEDALNVIGVKSGEEVRLHSVVALENKTVSHRIKSVKAHAPTDSEIERRRRLVGGGRHAPIASAEASLGMESELPWAWVDADIRDSLGLDRKQRLQAVIVEPSRRYAFIDSLAEFAIVSALAAVGAITVLFPGGGDSQEDVYTPDGGAVTTFGILIAIPFVFLLWRLRRRLK